MAWIQTTVNAKCRLHCRMKFSVRSNINYKVGLQYKWKKNYSTWNHYFVLRTEFTTQRYWIKLFLVLVKVCIVVKKQANKFAVSDACFLKVFNWLHSKWKFFTLFDHIWGEDTRVKLSTLKTTGDHRNKIYIKNVISRLKLKALQYHHMGKESVGIESTDLVGWRCFRTWTGTIHTYEKL